MEWLTYACLTVNLKYFFIFTVFLTRDTWIVGVGCMDTDMDVDTSQYGKIQNSD